MQATHALSALARLEEAVQAWRSVEELAAYLNMPGDRVRRAARQGLVPHRRRPGAGRSGQIRVRAREFESIAERLRTMAREVVPQRENESSHSATG
jgi:hypothetical protein